MRTLVSLNPFADFKRFADLVDRTFTPEFEGLRNQFFNLNVPMDIYEQDGAIKIRASVPGVNPQDLRLSVDNGVLTLSGETRDEAENDPNRKVYHREHTYGRFSRSVRLPDDVNENAIDAEFKNGFVTVTVPRLRQEEAHPRQVKIRYGDAQASGPTGATVDIRGEVRTSSDVPTPVDTASGADIPIQNNG